MRKSERVTPRFTLRNLVLSCGGRMFIRPDIMRSRQFRGWRYDQISRMVYELRQENRDGEVWALYKGCIYARETDLPPALWRVVCDTRLHRIRGVAENNRVFEERYKTKRPENLAQEILDENIEVLSLTAESSVKVVRTLTEIDESTES